MRYLLSTMVLLFTTVPAALAWQPAIAINAGTQGAGVTFATPVAPGWINLAAQANYFSFDLDFDLSGINYSGTAKLRTGGLLVKIFPFHSSFNLQGGAYYNRNRLKVRGEPKNPNVPVQVNGHVEFRDIAPYAGFGLGNTVSSGRMTFTASFGVLFQGEPQVHLNTNSNNPLARAYARQKEDDLQDKVDDFRFYPVLRLGLAFKL